MSSAPSPDAIRSALSHVIDPDLHKDVVSLNAVKDLSTKKPE